jgi:hypothetical protein
MCAFLFVFYRSRYLWSWDGINCALHTLAERYRIRQTLDTTAFLCPSLIFGFIVWLLVPVASRVINQFYFESLQQSKLSSYFVNLIPNFRQQYKLKHWYTLHKMVEFNRTLTRCIKSCIYCRI